MDKTEILTNLGVVLAGMLGIWAAYFKKTPPPTPKPEAVLTGVGLEIGNRFQIDEQNSQLRRIADALEILADRRQANLEHKLDELLERIPDHPSVR